jgi:hypothetical protein
MTDRTDLQYTEEHEWVKVDGETVTIGITDYAAEKLGDVVYVDLPSAGTAITTGTVVGEIESTKSVGELFAPVDGEVVEPGRGRRARARQQRPVRRGLAHQGDRRLAAEAPHARRVPRPHGRVTPPVG